MASNTRRISYNDVNKHPEASILLAYLRGQELELRSSVIQHIEYEKCPVCLRKLNELKQASAPLDVLATMQSYQRYPELSAAETFVRMQNAVSSRTPGQTATNGANYRYRPRKSAMRLISVPVAFGMAILFTMAMLVFANFSGRSFNPFSNTGSNGPGQHVFTVDVPPHAKATRGVDVTVTPKVVGTATPIDTPGVKEPYIKLCSTQANIDHMRLVICGFHFDSKHKANVIAFVPAKKPLWVSFIPVDQRGEFQVAWTIFNCSNVPVFIFGYEETSSKLIFVRLQITSFGNCSARINPYVKPAGLKSNFVP